MDLNLSPSCIVPYHLALFFLNLPFLARMIGILFGTKSVPAVPLAASLTLPLGVEFCQEHFLNPNLSVDQLQLCSETFLLAIIKSGVLIYLILRRLVQVVLDRLVYNLLT